MTLALFMVVMWACELALLVGCCVAWERFLCLYDMEQCDMQQNQTCLCSPFIFIYNAKLP